MPLGFLAATDNFSVRRKALWYKGLSGSGFLTPSGARLIPLYSRTTESLKFSDYLCTTSPQSNALVARLIGVPVLVSDHEQRANIPLCVLRNTVGIARNTWRCKCFCVWTIPNLLK
jgi:hypothetical protein